MTSPSPAYHRDHPIDPLPSQYNFAFDRSLVEPAVPCTNTMATGSSPHAQAQWSRPDAGGGHCTSSFTFPPPELSSAQALYSRPTSPFDTLGEPDTSIPPRAQLGSSDPPLSRSDLATRTYMLATIYWSHSERERQALASKNEVKDLPGLFTDLRIRLEDGFQLTKEQKENIRCITQDLIYKPTQFTFKALFIEVDKSIRDNKEQLNMTNIFFTPAREKVLTSHIRKTCSSVRNGFRQDVRDSVMGEKIRSLQEFTFQIAFKYKRGGPGERLDIGYTIHNALLRRFALDNPQSLNYEEDEDGNIIESSPDNRAGSSRKKRKTTASGRVPQGQDFWSKVDKYFQDHIKEKGRNLTAPAWKSLVDDVIRRDEQSFPPPGSMAGTARSQPAETTWAAPDNAGPQTTYSPASTTDSSGPRARRYDLISILQS
ncbi:hypothetical protein C8Q78DRAFT_1035408 [Trametes maxima]|nr:hypothetical protein C8Q78DRAFT_1035408 [Trametes maxima]